MSQERQSTISSLWFENLYQLLDAMMFFGATLEPNKPHTRPIRMSIARTWSQRPALFFGLSLLHNHGISMKLRSGPGTIGQKITYASPASRLYRASYDRWYPESQEGRRAQTPEDLRINRRQLIVWLVGSLAFARSKRSKVVRRMRLPAPRLSYATAVSIAAQIRLIQPQFDLRIATGLFAGIEIFNAETVEIWLAQHVPETAWSRADEMLALG